GRCVSADTGEPLEGCRVKFTGRPSTGGKEAEDPSWKDPDVATTGSTGRFEFAYEPPSTYQFSLDIHPPGLVPRTGRWHGFKPAQVTDLGDIPCSRGWPVSGRVVDVEGNPVSGVGVGLNALPLPITRNMAANAVRYGTSREDGTFDVVVPIPAGTFPLMLSGFGARPCVLVEPKVAVVKEVGGVSDLRVVVRRMPSISGFVLDGDGRPMEGFLVEARYPPDYHSPVPPRLRGGQMASSWTQENGSFEIYARYDDPGPMRLAYGPRRPLLLNSDGRTFEWGEKDVRLVYARRPSLELTVVEAGTSRPVEEFSVRCHRDDLSGWSGSEARLRGRHEGGRVTIGDLEIGRHRLVVMPKDPALLPEQATSFDVPAAGPVPPMRIEVERASRFRVRLTGPGGEPLVGSKVELLRSQPENPVRVRVDTPSIDHRLALPSWSSEGNLPVLISSAETDSSGLAALGGPPGGRGYALRIVGPLHPPIVREDVVLPREGETVEIVAGAATGLRGRVLPRGSGTLGASLKLQRVREPELRLPQDVPIGPDGAFEVGGLSPGVWEVRLQLVLALRGFPGQTGFPVACDPPLGVFELEEGEIEEVALDASRFTLGSVDGTVVAENGPRPLPNASLAVRTPTFTGETLEVPTSEEGRFHIEALLPAEYRLVLTFPDGKRIEDGEWFSVGPGERVVREFRPKAR
ncbi:MAG TPA: carboxypeptidase-like regulatory domain-containing protein, partial [Planctomycetota bacterium]|nr:carboxypeptidase-like regulatory domain-containing protein [Planctomycetota bacterium]